MERLRRWLRWDRQWGCRLLWLTDADDFEARLGAVYVPILREAVNRANPLMTMLEERKR